MRVAFEPSTESVDVLERQLMRSLRRVEPRTEFVDHLQTRLRTPPTTILERRESTAMAMLIAAAALVFGVSLIFLLRWPGRNSANAANAAHAANGAGTAGAADAAVAAV